jgi:uncharacterized protein (DUF433 family)
VKSGEWRAKREGLPKRAPKRSGYTRSVATGTKAQEARTPVHVGDMIVATEGTVGGKPRIRDTRMPVHRIADYHVREGMTAEQIKSEVYEHLDLLQIYAALAYFYANREEIEKIWSDDEKFEKAFRKKYPDGWRRDNDQGMPEIEDE